MPLLAAVGDSLFWDWIWPILQFLIGLDVVVFFHELGHFLVAKWAGIKVERFAIGMGPRLFGFRRGETDYCYCALPLGGYVKMLGQDDFAPTDEAAAKHPRSFEAKSVGTRFAVIAAGVIMNVILAAALFVVVGMVGMEFIKPVVGGVVPASPAAKAKLTPLDADANDANVPPGLRANDEILTVDGTPVQRFSELKARSILAGADSTFELVIQRPGPAGPRRYRTTLGVKRMYAPELQGLAYSFGIRRPASNEIGGLIDQTGPLQLGDRIVRIADANVSHLWDIEDAAWRMFAREVPVTVLRDRDGQPERVSVTVRPMLGMQGVVFLNDGNRIVGEQINVADDGLKHVILTDDGDKRLYPAEDIQRAVLLDVLGMRPRLRIEKISPDTSAQRAGLRAGDIIVSYGDRSTPTWDQLRRINEKVVGKATPIVVLRDGNTIAMDVTPRRENGTPIIGFMPGADGEHIVVAGVREGSLADSAGVIAEDLVTAVNGDSVAGWPDLVDRLAGRIGEEITLTVRRGVETMDLELGTLHANRFDRKHYIGRLGAEFTPVRVHVSYANPLSALMWGVGETRDRILEGYATLRRLITRDLSTKAISGPVGMGAIAVRVAREGLVKFVYFMAVISAILAVMNFLPIPVVDGGHAVFLLIEKIRGKPLPLRVQNAVQMAGLALLLLVFVLITWQDITRLFSA
jgi:regulator of sigma E protease